jgi:hypothetical protein
MKNSIQSICRTHVLGPCLVLGGLLLSSVASAITLNGGYAVVYDNGAYQFETVWTDLAKAPAVQNGDRVTFGQNTSLCQDNIGDVLSVGGEAYWCDNPKTVVLSSYEAKTVTAGSATTYTFSGCFGDSDLDATVLPFIKVFSTGYALFGETYGADGACWDLSIPSDGAVDVIVQTGYQVTALTLDPRVSTSGSIAAYEGATQNPDRSSALTDPTGIPVLPLWALFGLAGLIGLMGLRRKA